jgi:hypothetical protein
MRLRLLLIVLLAIAGMGANCGGGGSSGSADTSAASSSTASIANSEGGTFVPAVPEPSAALVFGLGVLIAGAVAQRKR